MSEKELVEACKAGEKPAYRLLYETYSQYMLGVCFRYIGNQMHAEDVLHDGFVKVFQSLASFQYRGEGSLKAWMAKIFYHESILFLRRDKQWRNSLSIEEDQIQEEPDLSGWQSLSSDRLIDFIADLPVGYRLVFNMFVFENMSHKEIGLQLGIKEDTSRTRLLRARIMLTKKITKYLSENE